MKKLGDLTKEEGKQALTLYEKKMAIDNLVKILDKDTEKSLYEKAVKEQDDVNQKYDSWWRKICEKYYGIYIENQEFYIDFRKNSIFLQE
nr:CXXX repeat peptide modification system protein [uncultured Sellimonas sp.]